MQQAISDIVPEIRAALGRRNMRQRALAKRMGVSEQYICRRMRGYVDFSLSDLQHIARILDVSLNVEPAIEERS
jgi:transcriptional regulator with XRE-family HTH domain